MKKENAPQLDAKIKVFRGQRGKTDLLGFADLIIAGAFVIRGIRILRLNPERAGGEVSEPFISFPSRKAEQDGQTRYFDVAHPITAEAYQAAVRLIMSRYQAEAAA